jgi:hypothetical protein
MELMAALLLNPSRIVVMYKAFCIYRLSEKSSLIQFGEGGNGMAEQIFIKEGSEIEFYATLLN